MQKVSVLLPVYNGEQYIARAVESVLDQSFKDYELLIFNDGSTDRTQDILEKYRVCHNVRIFADENKGVAKTLNHACSLARGKYITFISHDDFWLPYKLATEVKTLESCSRKIGVAYSNFYQFYEETKGIHPKFLAQLTRRQIREKCAINISSALVRRSVLDRLKEAQGYIFDPTLQDCMDWDLWIRLDQICDFKHIPQLLSYYGIHRKQMTRGFSHGVASWKLHLKWNGFDPRFFVNSVIRAPLRNMLGRSIR